MAEVITPTQESALLDEVNQDVVRSMKSALEDFGKIFGTRIYDEDHAITARDSIIQKIKLGLFGVTEPPVPEPDPTTPEPQHETDQERLQASERETQRRREIALKEEKNTERATEIFNIFLKERPIGLDNVYMNYVFVVHVKANLRSTSQNVQILPMFRFAKNSKDDPPYDNFFIGVDRRLYSNWADFINNNKIVHNSLVLAPKCGAFNYTSGVLDLDIFHVTRYFRTFVEPVLGVVGLVGTGMLCASLPPVGLAVGLGASGVGAIAGVSRGIVDLVDAGSHHSLLSTSSIIPTLNIASNLLFVHSALGALRVSNSVISSERFLQSVLLTENALRIGAVSRLSVDVLSTVIAFCQGDVDWLTAATRIASNFIFLYNVYINMDTIHQSDVPYLMELSFSVLTYDNVQPLVTYFAGMFNMPDMFSVQSLQDIRGIIAVVLQHLNSSDALSPALVTRSLRRLLNVRWMVIMQDLQRCKTWIDKFFTVDEYIANFSNIQMAVVYTLHKDLESYVIVNEDNYDSVQHILEDLMKHLIQLWKRMYAIVFTDENPDIRRCTMIMRYILRKIDELMTGSNPDSPGHSPPDRISVHDFAFEVRQNIVKADIYALCEECQELIAQDRLEPVRYVIQDDIATVSFIQQQSDDVTTEQVYEDGHGEAMSLCKIDPESRLGVMVKYSLN
uniref:DUF4781 domain-containing protein n=1 Tax=Cacopsylla melanoneura TaxID=428564 RepID=A0A8D8VB26_9HEMI